MIVVGLTGGIGSGKTTVGRMFKKLGVPVYNSDKEAKKLMRSSKKIRKAIKELLGDESYSVNKLNKEFVANKVFNNKDLLEQMNAIVHPAVRKHFSKWVKKQETPYVIQEAAIIFENSMHEFYDKVILVTAPKTIRIERLKARDASSESQIKARMKNQWDDIKKEPLADFVIENIQRSETSRAVKVVNRLLLDHSGQ